MHHVEMPGDTMDFGALAARLAVNIEDVRACLLMSRDGLTLGVYPRDQEEMARDIWNRLQSIGDPDRGFLTVRDELWILARRGPYVGVVVASASATPGLLLDRLEFTLRAAEELRMQEGSAGGPRTEATRRPRTSLHREPSPGPGVPRPERAPVRPAPSESEAPEAPPEPVPMLDLSGPDAFAEPQATEEPAPGPTPEPAVEAASAADEGPLDPVRAAMEFASMTGAVGAIPTMPRPRGAARARPAPVREGPPEPDEGHDEGADEPPLLEAEGPPLMDDPVAEEPARVASEPEPAPEPEADPEPDPEADPEADPEGEPAAPSWGGDEAEVDPVALAREFAQLVNDDEEEAR